MRVVLYLRISDDKTGQAVGVTDQERDCRIIAERLGATTITVLTDNDISASKYGRKVRPGYQQLLDMIRAESVDVIIAWHADRLYRRPAELEELVRIVEDHHVRIETFRAGVVDLATAAGRMQARNLGTYGAYESEIKSERIRARLQYRAVDGHPHGDRAYGWLRARSPEGNPIDIVHPDEAAVIRRIAATVLSGESLNGLCRQLNAEGVPCHHSGVWTSAKVRSLVLRPRNAGLRTHHGKVVSDGTWTPLLPREDWERVTAILKDPRRNVTPGPEPVHLLSGIAKCGVCGSPLRALKVNTTPSYKCPKFCVSRNRPDTDRWVTENMIQLLLEPDAVHLLAPPAQRDDHQASEEAALLRAQLDNAASHWALRKIDDRQLSVISAELRPRLEAVEARIAATSAPSIFAGLLGLDADTLAAAWAGLSIRRQRAAITTAFDVTVHRSRSGRRPFDPASVDVVKRRAVS